MAQECFCHDSSLQAGEAMFGTAPHAAVWFLLEYNGVWGRKAFEESDLPAPVKARLSGYLDAIPDSRLQFIKQEHPRQREGVAFFVAVAREADPALYEFHLDGYDALLALDLDAVVAGAPGYARYLREAPLFLACTNGRRDRCCAKFGLPVYHALTDCAGDAVWQSTHMGGHRFAGVAACFPHGVCYGRLEPGDAAPVVESYRAGRILLDRYRGRACYDKVTQAADYLLRAATGDAGLDAFRWLGTARVGDDGSAARFAARFAAGGRVHRLEVAQVDTGLMVYQSCSDPEPSRLVAFELRAHEVRDDAPATTPHAEA